MEGEMEGEMEGGREGGRDRWMEGGCVDGGREGGGCVDGWMDGQICYKPVYYKVFGVVHTYILLLKSSHTCV